MDHGDKKDEPLAYYGVNRDGHLIFDKDAKQGCALYAAIIVGSLMATAVVGVMVVFA